MMRSLWTAASGMIAQQTNVDTISNNLANVNSTAYKTEKAEFKSLLYQTLQTKTTSQNGENKPIGAQVGLGVRNSTITSEFTQGALTATEKSTDFAIDGAGFFAIRGEDGELYYTRNGSFNFAVGVNGDMVLSNDSGWPVLDTNGRAITISNQYNIADISISSDGSILYKNANNNTQPLGIKIGLFQFNNPSGLNKTSGTMYQESEASGAAINEENLTGQKSNVYQGYLEGSNVQVVDEMVNLIIAQRAYEMNSKAIQSADEMMGQANALKR